MSEEITRLTLEVSLLRESLQDIAREALRPSAIFKPELSIDGNKYCALYGKHLMNGVAGFGDTPEEAMRDFDRNFFHLPPGRFCERPGSQAIIENLELPHIGTLADGPLGQLKKPKE